MDEDDSSKTQRHSSFLPCRHLFFYLDIRARMDSLSNCPIRKTALLQVGAEKMKKRERDVHPFCEGVVDPRHFTPFDSLKLNLKWKGADGFSAVGVVSPVCQRSTYQWKCRGTTAPLWAQRPQIVWMVFAIRVAHLGRYVAQCSFPLGFLLLSIWKVKKKRKGRQRQRLSIVVCLLARQRIWRN